MTEFVLLADGLHRRRVAGASWELLSKAQANALLQAYADAARVLDALANECSGMPDWRVLGPLLTDARQIRQRLEALE